MDHDNCPMTLKRFEHYRWKGRYIKYQLLLLLLRSYDTQGLRNLFNFPKTLNKERT